jgi:SNF2 family DNA or RNA helicase
MTNYDDIPVVIQPDKLRIDLFRHQLASIYQMEKFENEKEIDNHIYKKKTKLGINADYSGFGKTLSMIGLIVRDKMKWDISTPYIFEDVKSLASGLVQNIKSYYFTKIDSTLILVSPSIINQWEQELSYSDLSVFSVNNKKTLDILDQRIGQYDVVLITPTMYNRLIRTFSKFAWKRFIFDEPGHLRVSGMKEVKAGFYWFVTATPNAITSQHQNCKGSFMHNIADGYGWLDFESQYRDIILKNNFQFVQASFEMPATIHNYHECYQAVFNAINGFVSPQVTTMVEAGNIEGAIATLGGGKTGNIVELVRNRKVEQLHEINSKIEIYSMRNDEAKVAKWTQRKNRIEIQINEIDRRFDQVLLGNCFICIDKLKSPVMEINCQNVFCGECLFTWLQTKSTCPLCRARVNPSTLVYIDTDENIETTFKPVKRKMTKLEKIIDIINKNPVGKFIIFSSFNNTFKPICDILEENQISYTMLKGNSTTRQRNIDDFKTGNIQVIFLNSNFNGAGINLQEATDIILFHGMSINTENQIIGRANRIGRTISLNVHHLQIQNI